LAGLRQTVEEQTAGAKSLRQTVEEQTAVVVSILSFLETL